MLKQQQLTGVPLWLSGLRIQHCHCCGMSLVPGLRSSTCHGQGQKQQKIPHPKLMWHLFVHLYIFNIGLASANSTAGFETTGLEAPSCGESLHLSINGLSPTVAVVSRRWVGSARWGCDPHNPFEVKRLPSGSEESGDFPRSQSRRMRSFTFHLHFISSLTVLSCLVLSCLVLSCLLALQGRNRAIWRFPG